MVVVINVWVIFLEKTDGRWDLFKRSNEYSEPI